MSTREQFLQKFKDSIVNSVSDELKPLISEDQMTLQSQAMGNPIYSEILEHQTGESSDTGAEASLFINADNTLTVARPTTGSIAVSLVGSIATTIPLDFTATSIITLSNLAKYNLLLYLSGLTANATYSFVTEWRLVRNNALITQGVFNYIGTGLLEVINIPMFVNFVATGTEVQVDGILRLTIKVNKSGIDTQSINILTSTGRNSEFLRNGGVTAASGVTAVWNGDVTTQQRIDNDINTYIDGVNPIALAKGGTGATNALGARINIGLGNVNDTSDLNKPISNATQTALDGKQPIGTGGGVTHEELNAGLAGKENAFAVLPIAKGGTDSTSVRGYVNNFQKIQAAFYGNTLNFYGINDIPNGVPYLVSTTTTAGYMAGVPANCSFYVSYHISDSHSLRITDLPLGTCVLRIQKGVNSDFGHITCYGVYSTRDIWVWSGTAIGTKWVKVFNGDNIIPVANGGTGNTTGFAEGVTVNRYQAWKNVNNFSSSFEAPDQPKATVGYLVNNTRYANRGYAVAGRWQGSLPETYVAAMHDDTGAARYSAWYPVFVNGAMDTPKKTVAQINTFEYNPYFAVAENQQLPGIPGPFAHVLNLSGYSLGNGYAAQLAIPFNGGIQNGVYYRVFNGLGAGNFLPIGTHTEIGTYNTGIYGGSYMLTTTPSGVRYLTMNGTSHNNSQSLTITYIFRLHNLSICANPLITVSLNTLVADATNDTCRLTSTVATRFSFTINGILI